MRQEQQNGQQSTLEQDLQALEGLTPQVIVTQAADLEGCEKCWACKLRLEVVEATDLERLIELTESIAVMGILLKAKATVLAEAALRG